jgi:hypothetical protein
MTTIHIDRRIAVPLVVLALILPALALAQAQNQEVCGPDNCAPAPSASSNTPTVTPTSTFSCNLIQSYAAAGTYTAPVSGPVVVQVIGGGGGGAGSSYAENQNTGGGGGSGAASSVTGPFGTFTAQGGSGGSNAHAIGTAGSDGQMFLQSVTLNANDQFTVTIGGGGGGGGGGGISGSGPAGTGGSVGTPPVGGIGGVGQSTCGWQGSGHSGPAGSGGSGGVSSGGGGGAGSSGDNGNYGCAAGQTGGDGTLAQGGLGGLNGGYGRWTVVNAAGGTAPGGGGAGARYAGGGGGGASGAVNICQAPVSCTVTFDQNPLTGQSTTMHWSSTGNPTLFYINSVGYVGASGSAQVFSAGDYSGYVTDGSGNTASCTAVLGGSGTNGQCQNPALSCGGDGNLHDSCGNTTTCQWGCSTQTNQCNTSCQDYNTCDVSGSKVVSACSGVVVDDCSLRGGNWSCQAGSCVASSAAFQSFSATGVGGQTFTATGHLQALPALVPAGLFTHLYWNVANAKDCSIVGTNGDSWTDVFSGAAGKLSRPISQQTVYTLTCDSFPGAAAPNVSDSVTVNIVPSFNER